MELATLESKLLTDIQCVYLQSSKPPPRVRHNHVSKIARTTTRAVVIPFARTGLECATSEASVRASHSSIRQSEWPLCFRAWNKYVQVNSRHKMKLLRTMTNWQAICQ